MADRRPEASAENALDCTFCNRSFVREHAFLVHMCPNKTKWLNREEKYVKLGFMVYQKFYAINYGGKRQKQYKEFMTSKLYTAFTKFGRYLLHVNAINPEGFAEFLIRTGLPMKQWHSPVVYDTYIRELAKKESASAAVERNLLLMEQWAAEYGEEWTAFFAKVTPALATHYIRSGRLSPWVLYTAPGAPQLFDRLSAEQLALIKEYIDPGFWKIKFERHSDDVDAIKQVLAEAGV